MYKIVGVLIYPSSDPQIKVLSATGTVTEITIPINKERSVFDSVNALVDEANKQLHTNLPHHSFGTDVEKEMD